MKKIFSALMASAAIFTMFSCSKDEPENQDPGSVTPPETTYAEPEIIWEWNEDFSTVDIDDNLDAVLDIKAEAGIKSVVVTVDSDELENVLSEMSLSNVLDITSDQAVIKILKGLAPGLPVGDALVGKTEVEFDITGLVSLILDVTEEDSEHSFIVKVTDNEEQTVEKTCKFHRVGEPAASPVVVWTANPDGTAMPVDGNLDAKLAVTAEAGVKSIYITIGADLQAIIGLETETFDIVTDEAAISRLQAVFGDEFATGSGFAGQQECTVDLAPLASMLVAEGTNTISVTVIDTQDQRSDALECDFSVAILGDGSISTLLAPYSFQPNLLDESLEAVITLGSPAMFKSVTIDFPDALAAELAKEGISNPVELVNDAKAIEYFSSRTDVEIPTGDELRYMKEARFDLTALLMKLNDLVSDGTVQMLNMSFEDYLDRSWDFSSIFGDYIYFQPEVKATLSITWPGNEDFAEWAFSADNKPQALHIEAPDGIKSLTVTVTSDNSTYETYVNAVTGDNVLDFINESDSINSNLIGGFGYDGIAASLKELPIGDAVKDATELDFNLAGFLEFADFIHAPGTHTFVIDVEDNSGNKASVTCKFVTAVK